MMDNKIEKERDIFDIAIPFLKSIYSNVVIDEKQVDKPDAAFFTSEIAKIESDSKRRVGVEITCVDNQNDLMYENATKVLKPYEEKQINEILTNGAISNNPNKKRRIFYGIYYIYEGSKSKAELFDSYIEGGFDEIILLTYSNFLNVDTVDFNYLSSWSDFLFSKENFPFSKVIFSCIKTGKTFLIYDKKNPTHTKPSRNIRKEKTKCYTSGPYIPVNQTVSMGQIVKNSPLVKKIKGEKTKQRSTQQQFDNVVFKSILLSTSSNVRVHDIEHYVPDLTNLFLYPIRTSLQKKDSYFYLVF